MPTPDPTSDATSDPEPGDDPKDAAIARSQALWKQAALAVSCYAVDPGGLGGLHICGGHGPVHRRIKDLLQALFEETAPQRLSAQVDMAALDGGIDLLESVAEGQAVHRAGLLALDRVRPFAVDRAESLGSGQAQRLARFLDDAEHGSLIAFDEASSDDEGLAPSLAERLSLMIFTDGIRLQDCLWPPFDGDAIKAARARLPDVDLSTDQTERLAAIAAQLGIVSLRAPLAACRVARILAALAGRDVVDAADVTSAVTLVLMPRAKVLPQSEPEEETPPPPPEPEQQQPDTEQQSDTPDLPDANTDIDVEADLCALPPHFWPSPSRLARRGGKAGQARRQKVASTKASRGRPGRVRRAKSGEIAGLDLLATLTEAVRQQPLRRLEYGDAGSALRILPEDLRVRDRVQPQRRAVIFVVDASGSHAAGRMAQAKGAILGLLADCYVRRDEVALIAFKGREADCLLPLTRSLVRASRSLKVLPGGGATPLASGLEMGLRTALAAMRDGKRPQLLVITDGKANVTLDGHADRTAAEADALETARHIHRCGVDAVLLDTSARPSRQLTALQEALSAVRVPLPRRGDAGQLAAAVAA